MTQLASPILRSALTAAALSAAALAAQAQPAVIFDMGGKFDKSFNQAGYQGAEQWKKETGKTYLEFEISNDTQRVQAIRRMAERGASPIISIGFAQASALQQVAKDFPKTQFAIIDAKVDLPNVQSLLFKEFSQADESTTLGVVRLAGAITRDRGRGAPRYRSRAGSRACP